MALLPSRGSHPGCRINPPTQIKQCSAARARVQLAQLGTGELREDLKRALAGSAAVCSACGGTARCVARAGQGCARAARRGRAHHFSPKLGI